MNVADEIQRLGFRRWYERQLIESHAYLLTAFLALILLMAGFESLAYLRGAPVYYLAMFGLAAGAGLLMLVAWRRFNVLLARAEQFANGATCARCAAWGKFKVVATESVSDDDPVEAGRPHWVDVCCSKCGNRWRLG